MSPWNLISPENYGETISSKFNLLPESTKAAKRFSSERKFQLWKLIRLLTQKLTLNNWTFLGWAGCWVLKSENEFYGDIQRQKSVSFIVFFSSSNGYIGAKEWATSRFGNIFWLLRPSSNKGVCWRQRVRRILSAPQLWWWLWWWWGGKLLQCHTSHSGSPLQYQYNSGPCQVPQSTCDWHPGTLESVNLTTQDHIWPYNTGHYDNKTEQFDETCHHPTEEILKYNSKGSVVIWSVGNVF